MFNWINFFNFLFFFVFFIFLFNAYNFFFLLLTSEILWVVLYSMAAVYGVIVDDSFLISFSFFILGFAAIELAMGVLILVFLKQTNLSLNLYNNQHESLELYIKQFLKKNKEKKRV